MLLVPGRVVEVVVAQVGHLAKVEMVDLDLAQTLLQTSLAVAAEVGVVVQMEAMLRRD